MEQAEPLDAELVTFAAERATLDEQAMGLMARIAEDEVTIDAELADVVAKRAEAVDGIPAELLHEYESLRARSAASASPGSPAIAARVATSRCRPSTSIASVVRRTTSSRTAPSATACWFADLFFWFVGVGWLLVVAVFQSPALDYRLVMLGTVVPLADAVTGGPWVLHTLLASVALLAIVMLATQRRRLVRRRWLGLPIGMFIHLVLDGAWANTHVFWWPAFGVVRSRPIARARPGRLSVVMELVGVAALLYAWNRFGLRDPAARDRFLRTGQLPR